MKSSTISPRIRRIPRTAGTQLRKASEQLDERFPETASFFVPHPLFETEDAEKAIFGEDGVDGHSPVVQAPC